MSAKDIERLADLIANYGDFTCDGRYEEMPAAIAGVRAILTALREPSEEMARSGWRSSMESGELYAGPTKAWQAMIDHLLAD